MIEIILLIVGAVYAIRYPKLQKLTTEVLPGVDAAKVFEWRSAELLANDWYLCVTWGTVLIKIALSFILSQAQLTNDEFVTVSFAGLVLWFGGLTVAAIYGSKAKRLRRALLALQDETRSRRSPQVARARNYPEPSLS